MERETKVKLIECNSGIKQSIENNDFFDYYLWINVMKNKIQIEMFLII